MISQKSISRRLLFPAIFFGLNLLCFMGGAHGRHIERHTRVNVLHASRGMGRVGSRSGWSGTVVRYDSLFDNMHVPVIHGVRAGPAPPSHAALMLDAAVTPRPTMIELLARENVLALGSAPRAPGLARGPPVS